LAWTAVQWRLKNSQWWSALRKNFR